MITNFAVVLFVRWVRTVEGDFALYQTKFCVVSSVLMQGEWKFLKFVVFVRIFLVGWSSFVLHSDMSLLEDAMKKIKTAILTTTYNTETRLRIHLKWQVATINLWRFFLFYEIQLPLCMRKSIHLLLMII